MKNKLEILRQIEKNLTYESIRFNNKQISDQIIKNSIDEYFPKIFSQEKSKEITFFTKAMKDQDFYKKIRAMVSMQLGVEMHLQQIQKRQIEKSKIQDADSHGVEEMNKKMTRAALAKRYQQTQQQLRKDQIYVRLTPKTQQCLQWMLCNRKFPRIQCKLSCNQHIEYLVNYLSNKWLPGKGHNRILLYPDPGSYLKNNLSAKDRQRIIKQPLNNYFMFTDIMVGCGIGQNGILNLNYEIIEKKKDPIRPKPINEASIQYTEKSYNEKKQEKKSQIHQKIINLEEPGDSNQKKKMTEKEEQKYQNYIQANNLKIKSGFPVVLQSSAKKSNFSGAKIQSSINNQVIHQHSNHFLSNQSNLLNPNRSIYHDDESILLELYPFAGGNNSMGFDKRIDFNNQISLNSNSFIDIGHTHTLIKFQEKNNQTKPSLQRLQKIEQINLSSDKKDASNREAHKNINQNSLKPFSPRVGKSEKNSSFMSPKKQQKSKQIQQKLASNRKEFLQPKQDENQEIKKHQEVLIDLRNAINLLESVDGFNNPQVPVRNEEIIQKSLKQIKTVSIKKKTTN